MSQYTQDQAVVPSVAEAKADVGYGDHQDASSEAESDETVDDHADAETPHLKDGNHDDLYVRVND